jgi:hypothetical protein
MKRTQTYKNGIPVINAGTDFRRAKDLLNQKGLYRKMGNFGPYYPDKDSRCFTKLETFILDGIEFTIIESEVMSFSLNSQSVSQPHKQREAWFQPVK